MQLEVFLIVKGRIAEVENSLLSNFVFLGVFMGVEVQLLPEVPVDVAHSGNRQIVLFQQARVFFYVGCVTLQILVLQIMRRIIGCLFDRLIGTNLCFFSRLCITLLLYFKLCTQNDGFILLNFDSFELPKDGSN